MKSPAPCPDRLEYAKKSGDPTSYCIGVDRRGEPDSLILLPPSTVGGAGGAEATSRGLACIPAHSRRLLPWPGAASPGRGSRICSSDGAGL
eukprot:gene25272-biopygen10496